MKLGRYFFDPTLVPSIIFEILKSYPSHFDKAIIHYDHSIPGNDKAHTIFIQQVSNFVMLKISLYLYKVFIGDNLFLRNRIPIFGDSDICMIIQ